MRVRVYKTDEGELIALITPSPGKGKPPVLIRGITSTNVIDKVLPEVLAMRAPRSPRLRQLPQETD